MHRLQPVLSSFASICVAILLTACGGGGGESAAEPGRDNTANDLSSNTQATTVTEAGAPSATGDMATDGLNWTNFRRQQLGLVALVRNSQLDTAAQGHSDYQKANNQISHEQTPGAPGFTGATMAERLAAAGYVLTAPYAYGEVIAASGNPSGANAAEDLITAIYHRFVMFEPKFREAGAGSAAASASYHYFTLNLASNQGLGAGIGPGQFVTYPMANQQNVATVFYSDYETPDPVGDRNEVGYPVSIHADITASVAVQSFTIAPRGAAVLPAKLLSHATDGNTAQSVAAIVPLSVLTANTTYDVQFIGSIDGIAATRVWSFTTR